MQPLILISRDILGKNMAGPAIRYWEMAKALSKHYAIYLLTPEPCPLTHPGISLFKNSMNTLKALLPNAKGVVSQFFDPIDVILAKRACVPLILDAYDPLPIEMLELFKGCPLEKRNIINNRTTQNLLFCMKAADFILCASERQKDLWTGILLSLGKITPELYDRDPTLSSLIGIVPFGIPSDPCVKTGPGLKEKLHFRDKDKLFLWGGGIWNWFDPLSLIKAVAKLREKRDDIHLVFMGLKHPNDNIPAMQMTQDAIQLAKDLKMTDRAVHFNFNWVPYDERQNTLLESTAGVSMHFNNTETRYAFRTRLLDCLYAKLPIIATEGDYFSDLIERKKLGLVVKPQDVDGIANAMCTLSDDQGLCEAFRRNIGALRTDYTWENAVQPIVSFLSTHRYKPTRLGLMPYIHFSTAFIKEKGFSGVAKTLLKKLIPSK